MPVGISIPSLKAGMPADITVFRSEHGRYEWADTEGRMRDADTRIVPAMVFKDGRRHPIDMERCQDEKNWLLIASSSTRRRKACVPRSRAVPTFSIQ